MTQLHTDAALLPEDAANAADLTADDHLAVETAKEAPDDPDAALGSPDQDPGVVPASTVDENGQPR